jgi:hypothetical protein
MDWSTTDTTYPMLSFCFEQWGSTTATHKVFDTEVDETDEEGIQVRNFVQTTWITDSPNNYSHWEIT